MPRLYSTIKFPGQAYIITGAMVNNIYWTSSCLIKFKDLMLSVLMLELLNRSPNCEIPFLWTRKHINTYEYFINCYDIYEQKHIQIRTSQSSEWHHDSYGFSMGESILYSPHSTTYTCKSIHNVALDATDTACCLKSCCFSHLASLSIKYESCYSIDFQHSVTHSPEFQQKLRGRIISDAVCQSRKRSFCSILRCWRVQWQSFSPEIYQAPTVLHMNTNMGKHRVDNADIWDSLSRCRKLRKSPKGSDASSHWWITQASLKITQIISLWLRH